MMWCRSPCWARKTLIEAWERMSPTRKMPTSPKKLGIWFFWSRRLLFGPCVLLWHFVPLWLLTCPHQLLIPGREHLACVQKCLPWLVGASPAPKLQIFWVLISTAGCSSCSFDWGRSLFWRIVWRVLTRALQLWFHTGWYRHFRDGFRCKSDKTHINDRDRNSSFKTQLFP